MLEASSMCMPRDVSTWGSPLLYKSSLRNGSNFCGTENIISLASAVSRRIVGGGRFCLSARCEYICQLNRSWLGEKGRVSIQLSEECSCRVLLTVNSINSVGTTCGERSVEKKEDG